MSLGVKIAVIGAGRIGQTLIKAFLDTKLVQPENMMATTRHPETLEAVEQAFGLKTTLDNAAACRFADVILLCVKPQGTDQVLAEIFPAMTPKKLVITTIASVPTSFVEKTLGQAIPVIRTMPNTPCLIRNGMTGIAAGAYVKAPHLELAKKLFDTLGRSVVLEEKHLDAVTGLSGCGPAFMYMVIEAMAAGGVKMGLPHDIATLLAAQTMMGAGNMVLETGEHPAVLKDAVTTPAGCTIDGILALEEGALRVTLIKAVVHATQRARRLFSQANRLPGRPATRKGKRRATG